MNSKRIEPEQARQINASLEALCGYLNRLERRLHDVHFDNAAKLAELVSEAHRAVHAVRVELFHIVEGIEGQHGVESIRALFDDKSADQTRRGL